MVEAKGVEATGIVTRVADCTVAVSDGRWPFVDDRRDAIAAHWAERLAQNPRLFDGTIYMLDDWSIGSGPEGPTFRGRAVPVPFSAYLYWREREKAGEGIRHVFGVAAVRCADGGVLAIRASEGTMNAGMLDLPGGFADAGDVVGSGSAARLDVMGLALRELAEECGLLVAAPDRTPEFLVCQYDNEIGVCTVLDVDLTGDVVLEEVEAFRLRQPSETVEVSGATIVRSTTDQDIGEATPYTAAVLRELLRP